MEFTVTEEFVREAHGAACSTWKQRIEKEFPELFEKELEVGRWYVYGRSLLNYQGLNHQALIQAYGFLEDKSWMETSNCGNDFKSWEEATPEEVESALIAEAKKKGFVEGAFVDGKIFGNGWYRRRKLGGQFEFNNSINQLCIGDTAIFQDGKWAEILPEEKTIITKGKALRIIAKKLKVSPESIEIQ